MPALKGLANTQSTEARKRKRGQRLLLSYAFSNLTLKAQEIRPEYTLAFQFLQEWMPVVNEIFKPAESEANSGTFAPSDGESSSLRAWADAFRTFDWEKALPSPDVVVKEIGGFIALAS